MTSAAPKFLKKPYTSRIIFFLVSLTFMVFWQVRDFKFVNYDDNAYILENPFIKNGLTFHALKWAFTADLTFNSPYADYWQPITFLSRILDIQFFGLDPMGHHETNLVLHVLNVILVFFLFKRLTRAVWKSAILAALFAVHPIQVEAVAWVTSRKDLLSTLFGMLAIIWYAKIYDIQKPKLYGRWLCLLLFVCSLMCKGMFITFPLMLLLIDAWPLARFENYRWKSWVSFLFQKRIFILISAAFFMIPFIGQPEAFVYTSKFVIFQKAFHAYVKYLGKFVMPVNLGIYPQFMNPQFNIWISFGLVLMFSAVSVIVIKQLKKRPYLFTGWFWISITAAPVAGLNMMADRFMYVPLIGFLIIVIWGVDELLSYLKWSSVQKAWFACALILICAFLSYKQSPYWKDSKTAFERALKVDDRNFVIQNNLGLELLAENRVDEALACFKKSIEIYPSYALAYNNLGIIYANFKKMTDEGIRFYMRALELDPSVQQTYYNIANIYAEQGNRELAVKFFKAGAAINPDFQGKLTPTLVMMLLEDQSIRVSNDVIDQIQSASR